MQEHWRTELTIKERIHPIQHDQGILLLGSCFAEHIHLKLRAAGFDSRSNPTGVIYNPIALAKMFNYLLRDAELDQNLFLEREDNVFHYDFHGSFHAFDRRLFMEQLSNLKLEFKSWATKLQHCFLTLGTAFVYNYQGTTVANCHKQASSNFEKCLLSVAEVKAALKPIISYCKESGIQLHLTLSPVRHIRDGIQENTISKAILRTAIYELKEEFPDLDYFPAFEIMMDDLRDYRFYGRDLIHPNEQAVDYIWSKFKTAYCNEITFEIIDKVMKYRRMEQHRPLFPSSDSSRQFETKRQEYRSQLESLYPFLVW